MDTSARRDRIEFTVVGLDGVQDSVCCGHAVPGTIGLEIVGLVSLRRMLFLEGAEGGNLGPASIGIDSDHAVVCSHQSMGAARARKQSVEGAVDERHISDATH